MVVEMKELPDFPRYTGVHPAPYPVRREEPDWEVYTTKTVAERRAAAIPDAPSRMGSTVVQAWAPPEWNFGLGPATGFVSKAQVEAFYGRDSIAASRGLAEMKNGLKAFIDEHSPVSDKECGNCHIAGAAIAVAGTTQNLSPAQAVAVIEEKLAGYAKNEQIVADESAPSPWPNSMDAFREASRAFDAGEIAGYEVTVRNGKTESVTTTPWPEPVQFTAERQFTVRAVNGKSWASGEVEVSFTEHPRDVVGPHGVSGMALEPNPVIRLYLY